MPDATLTVSIRELYDLSKRLCLHYDNYPVDSQIQANKVFRLLFDLMLDPLVIALTSSEPIELINSHRLLSSNSSQIHIPNNNVINYLIDLREYLDDKFSLNDIYKTTNNPAILEEYFTKYPQKKEILVHNIADQSLRWDVLTNTKILFSQLSPKYREIIEQKQIKVTVIF